MEKGSKKLAFKEKEDLKTASAINNRGILSKVYGNLNKDNDKPIIPLGHGDPSVFPCFYTTPLAVEAIVDSVRSSQFNCYASSFGIPPARRAVAEYLSLDLSYKLSPDDVYLTAGCAQAIEVIISVLASPEANILLPRPGFPMYESRAAFSHLEARHFDLLPKKGWEIDLDSVEALVDENTVAMVIINPGNPCGNVYTFQHLKKVAETAKKLGIFVIADEVYGHFAFGANSFVPMGELAYIVPVLTLGSISKTWIVPGWRLGWIVLNDPNDILKKAGIVDSIKNYLNIIAHPATFVQGAIPQILEKTEESFFSNVLNIAKKAADICYDKISKIPCITCPHKPEGGMFVMVGLSLSLLDGITDDFDFCLKLAREDSVIVLPGVAVGYKNWLRIAFAVEPSILEEGLERLKKFCQRHALKQEDIHSIVTKNS